MLSLQGAEVCLLRQEEASSFAAKAEQESTQLACIVRWVLPMAQVINGQVRCAGSKGAQGGLSTVLLKTEIGLGSEADYSMSTLLEREILRAF